ncbi:MAG: NAD-dependent DNA ligase LigA [Longimicrobiales bacterium]|nr:NAD-dependent DNA ligase LigA [Longimicrobiales bacterium]
MSQTPFDLETPADRLDASGAEALACGLRAALDRHSYLYYVEARPEISDAEYDRLFRRLQEVEDAFPALVTPASPTQRVGVEPQDAFRTVEHVAPMLSLDSSDQEAALRRFDERIRKAVDEPVRYLLEPKLDGASLELVYQDGILVRAVTRGNGRAGEEVTGNVRTIPAVPLRLREDERAAPALLAVRGEVMMHISAFERFNEALVERGAEPYASPRNSAAGAVRQLDPRVTAERELDLLAYDVLHLEGAEPFHWDHEAVEALRQWGFRTPERVRVVETVEEILAYHAGFEADRDALDYEIDGVVIKLDHVDVRGELGTTSHHPRWAMAYKFQPRQEVTRVQRIALSVGRTGVLTPVALLLPVQVGGVTVSRASLHNREEVARKDVRTGDTVRVQRAGDVIPQVVERIAVDGEERGPPFAMPETCPACGTPVREDGPRTVCPNRYGCPAQLKGRIVHFGSRNALDIEGLGEETAVLLVDRGLVRELAGLFDLTVEQLVDLPGFAEKSATNLVEAIARRKRTELARFLHGLGIPEVGVAVARDLARHFRDIAAVREADREALEAVDGIGPRMSEVIHAFLHEPRNAEAIDHVLARGVELSPPQAEPASDALAGARFVFTGGLSRLSRGEARKRVEAAGAKVVGSVSRSTTHVVVGEGPGSKYDQAVALGIPVLDEASFLALLREAGIDVPGADDEGRESPAEA